MWSTCGCGWGYVGSLCVSISLHSLSFLLHNLFNVPFIFLAGKIKQSKLQSQSSFRDIACVSTYHILHTELCSLRHHAADSTMINVFIQQFLYNVFADHHFGYQGFPPHFINIVVEVKASGQQYVYNYGLW